MSALSYLMLPDGGFLATSNDRPDEYLTWAPFNAGNPLCAVRNVHVCRRDDDWDPRPIGFKLGWHAFQVLAETMLGVTDSSLTPVMATHTFLQRGQHCVCSCGHWRTLEGVTYSIEATRAWVAHVDAGRS